MDEHDTRKPHLRFARPPVPGVPLEVVYYLLTLPEETRDWLGRFLLDSSEDGFDGEPETSARLWREELARRIRHAEEHPEPLIPADEALARIEQRLEQLRRTPCPDHLHGFHCIDYFDGGYAERGHYDEVSHFWVVSPLHELDPGVRFGFFAVGGAGVDGVRFGYRFGHRGLWAYYPMGHEFVWKAATLAELVEGWCSGTISV